MVNVIQNILQMVKGKKKIRVAIVGSCSTRDNFYSVLNPGQEKDYECCFYQDRVSFVSMMSGFTIENPPIDLMEKWERKSYLRECGKTILKELSDSHPDCIILDFNADAYFGVVEHGPGLYFTHNWWHPKEVLEQVEKGRIITPVSNGAEYIELFMKAFDEFYHKVRATLPGAKLIMHKVKFAEEFINSPEGWEAPLEMINGTNASMSVLEEAVSDYGMAVIDIFGRRKVMGDYSHPWGFFPAHYERSYYPEFIIELNKVCGIGKGFQASA